MHPPVIVFGLASSVWVPRFMVGAEWIHDLNFRLERWGPAWHRRLRRWLNTRVVRPRALVWSYRLVGVAWVPVGVVLALAGFSTQ